MNQEEDYIREEIEKLQREQEKLERRIEVLHASPVLDPEASVATIIELLGELTPDEWVVDWNDHQQDKWLPMICYRSGALAICSAQSRCVAPWVMYRPKEVWQQIIAKAPTDLRVFMKYVYFQF